MNTDNRGYEPLFDPEATPQPFDSERSYRLGDRGGATTGSTPEVQYVFEPRITLAVNVSLATGRPILVRGHPGTGKSSLARRVALLLGWRYYPTTVSSRTTARDLQWTFDAVGRLARAEEAGNKPLPPRSTFIMPGPLWWAFDRETAARRGMSEDEFSEVSQEHGIGLAVDPSENPTLAERSVVLIDEIDKADPDVPNDLLQPLGSFRFQVEDGPLVEATQPPLVFVTTNEERDLPRAFVRRCIVLSLETPDDDRLKKIASAHYPDLESALLESVLKAYRASRSRRIDANEPPPSTAEFLDALAACVRLETSPEQQITFADLSTLILDKATTIPSETP